MVSVWWLAVLFFIGGSAGILVTALMCMAGSLSDPPLRVAKHIRVVLSDEY
ncbi:MAG TPA: hypothetical protein VGK37_11245 [Casimicrobiaceae bacterium]|jgi:hypothetical protein